MLFQSLGRKITKEEAAIRLQTVWRGKVARRLNGVDRGPIAKKHAAQQLQCLFRKRKVCRACIPSRVLLFDSVYQKQLASRIESRAESNAALRLQRLWKSKRGGIRAAIKEQGKAAALIQAHARRRMGVKQFNDRLLGEAAAFIIQASICA
jgi:hypothetical protein